MSYVYKSVARMRPGKTWAQARADLREMGRKAHGFRTAGWTLRDIADELHSNPAQICRALEALGEPATDMARGVRRAQLLADGRKALAFLAAGHSHDVALMAIGGSRARYFRAIREARLQDGTPDSEPVNPMLL